MWWTTEEGMRSRGVECLQSEALASDENTYEMLKVQ